MSGPVVTDHDSASSAARQTAQGPESSSNTMAMAGLALCLLAALLYAGLFYSVYQLPDTQPELLKLKENTPLLMRFMLLGGSACLLNVVALGLSAVALLQPGRQRILAVVGASVSGLLLLLIMCVILFSMAAAR